MSSRGPHLTRTGVAQNSVVVSSATAFSISTDDPSLSVTMAPQPALILGFGGAAKLPFAIVRATEAPPLAQPARAPAALPEPIADVPEPAAIAEERPVASAPIAEPERRPVPKTAPIELIIDSLTGHTLIEPIPVIIEPLGDTVFTAAVRNLNIQATGNSIGEALLLLKDQIESTYDDLNKRSRHDADEKTTLQMLQTYIAPLSKKSQWF